MTVASIQTAATSNGAGHADATSPVPSWESAHAAGHAHGAGPVQVVGSRRVDGDEIRRFRQTLTRSCVAGAAEGDLIDQLSELERLRRSISAAQARLAAEYAAARAAVLADQGVPARRRDDAVVVAVGLARHESPRRGSAFLGLARTLLADMPVTLGALADGVISEWAATSIVNETAVLSPSDRSAVDAALAGRLDGLSDGRIRGLARALSYEIDPAAHVARLRKAHGDRHVSARPAPDTMAYLTALLPAADAVAIIAALTRAAATARAQGDPRSTSNVMADTLTEAATGYRATCHQPDHPPGDTAGTDEATATNHAPGADDTGNARHGRAWADDPVAQYRGLSREKRPRMRPGDILPGYGPPPDTTPPQPPDTRETPPPEANHHPGRAADRPPGTGPSPTPAASRGRPPIEIGMVISAEALFGANQSSARLDGHDIPAWLARDLITADPDTQIRIRALYAHPHTGQLVAMQSQARTVTGSLRKFIKYRDQRCAMPYCDAPIRHIDHVTAYARRPETDGTQCRGLCERCNYLKEAPDLDTDLIPDPRHPDAPAHLRVTTPTGHSYTATIPPATATT